MDYITASRLYDYIRCPHRVWRDIHGPQEEKSNDPNPFIQLLWERGIKHEKEILSKLGSLLDLRGGLIDDRFQKTVAAMESGTPLIYQGVLRYDNMLGIPDLLKMQADGSYVPIDIKSGIGFDGGDDEEGEPSKPKKHYAAQLCLYGDVLNRLGFSGPVRGKILDICQNEVEYDLSLPMGSRTTDTWIDYYEKIKNQVDLLMNDRQRNKPAISGTCKLCQWHDSCKRWCEEQKDLSNVFYLGRSVRDKINEDLLIDDVDAFLKLDVKEVMKQKEERKKAGDKAFLSGIGEASLQKAVDRAKIMFQTKKPVIYGMIDLPETGYELFFDIEDDPTQEFVYLHGVYERNGDKERFVDFTAKELSEEAERETWRNFWRYIKSLPQDDFSVYYYSPHEKSTYRRMQKRYPDVILAEEVEEFFGNPNVIDLYGIIQKQTDWPVGSYSLKALAVYCGFHWRDETPSGSLSIQWFNNYLETKDESVLKRILEYNEDDCRATMVLKDRLIGISRGE